ncbi:MAG: cytochrome C [Bradyrhizobiaceae bacterium]|nr:MAG: cytochrome C [Bradyrhizobiaceae bacterium]
MRRAIALATLLAATSPALAQDEPLVRRGETLLTRHCAMCHAVGRTGASPHAQAPAFRTLSKRYKIDGLEEALGEGIISGHPDMPEFRFSAGDVGAVIAFLKAVQEP